MCIVDEHSRDTFSILAVVVAILTERTLCLLHLYLRYARAFHQPLPPVALFLKSAIASSALPQWAMVGAWLKKLLEDPGGNRAPRMRRVHRVAPDGLEDILSRVARTTVISQTVLNAGQAPPQSAQYRAFTASHNRSTSQVTIA